MIQIAFQLDLSLQEEQLLIRIFNCTVAELPDRLSNIGKAALTEYTKMFTGEKVFTRGKDMLEYRLINLIQSYYGGRIPSESEVSGMFQTSTSESRTLLRTISAKYQYVLETVIRDTLKAKLESDSKVNGHIDYRISLEDSFFREGFNKILSKVATHTPLQKDSVTTSIYIIKNAEYQYLCNELGAVATVNPY